MAVEVRPCTSDELVSGLTPIFHFFGSVPSGEGLERLSHVLPAERLHAAWEDGAAVGGAGAFPFELTVPGGRVPAAGITVVGVLPTHRRRGILRQMMRAQLDDVHERGEAVAYLWASEGTIYSRFGYGIGSWSGHIDLLRDRSAFRSPIEPGGRIRLIDHDEALELFPRVYDAVARETPGMFGRSRAWWEDRVLWDAPWRRRDAGEMARVVVEVDGEPHAYALYRVKLSFENKSTTGETVVIEAMGVSPGGTAAIWRYLLDVDWMQRIKASLLPVDHPLFFLLAEPRRLEYTVSDALWVRLVDVEAALAARRLRPGEPVVLDVCDDFCPWNAGRWRIGDGIERVDVEPEIRCDVAALGSVYLGGVTWTHLLRAGVVEELAPGAVERADGLFRADVAPWCPEIF